MNYYSGGGLGGALSGFYWALIGNSATVDGVNFQGTIDNIPATYRVNNSMSGRVDNTKRNTFWGFNAGGTVYNQVSSVDNVFIGNKAGFASTTGLGGNVFVGSNAGLANLTGFWNVFIGFGAGSAFTGGGLNEQNNVALGYNALSALTSTNDHTAIGSQSLINLTGGVNNSALGSGSGAGLLTGSQCTFLGATTGVTVGTESGSIALGFGATIASSNEMVVSGSGTFVNKVRYVYSGVGATHSEFFRTATPEAAQVGTRGDIAYVNDGANGSVYVKATGAATNTGWLQLATAGSVTTLYSGDGTLAGNRTVTLNGKSLEFTQTATLLGLYPVNFQTLLGAADGAGSTFLTLNADTVGAIVNYRLEAFDGANTLGLFGSISDKSFYWAFGSEGLFYVGTGSGSTATAMQGLMLNVKGAKYQLGDTDPGASTPLFFEIDTTAFTGRIRDPKNALDLFHVASSGIKTTDPGAGIGEWQLGTVITAASVLDTSVYVETKINGSMVKLATMA